MKSRRNHKVSKGIGVSVVWDGLRKALVQHIQKKIGFYAPALSPVVFFFLAHVITLLTLVFIKTGVLQNDQGIYKTVVTWAVYGFLPFLLCSYGSFYFVARPAAGALERKFPDWSATVRNLSSGGVYGAALVLALILLLRPDTGMDRLLLLLIGAAAGQGNWFFYRKLASIDA
ncbi:MAG: hypothetical protein JZU50_15800 [Desulfobulbaceae bacterium]|jgi:hypothetical protein|nr:hypothetical protein [Desulfobulbaceae bacterium]